MILKIHSFLKIHWKGLLKGILYDWAQENIIQYKPMDLLPCWANAFYERVKMGRETYMYHLSWTKEYMQTLQTKQEQNLACKQYCI